MTLFAKSAGFITVSLGSSAARCCPATPIAGHGVRASLLSTIRLPSGARQVTYAGHPLYLYREATERGETGYIGVSHFGGTWDALNASGGTVR